MALSYFGTIRIELIKLGEGESVFCDFSKDFGYGLHRMGFLIDNQQISLAEADAVGFKMIIKDAGIVLDGDGYYAYLDTEKEIGINLELIEKPKGRIKPGKIYPMDLDEKNCLLVVLIMNFMNVK